MKKRKLKYKELYNQVREISNKHDLMGLIRLGCPADEYDPEISEILPLIYKCSDVDELSIGIANIYNEMFEADFKASDKWISAIATDIYKLKDQLTGNKV